LRNLLLLSLLLVLFTGSAVAQDKSAYQFFRPQGKKAEYKQLLADARNADVILFGELHDNPIAHWLQLELAHDLLLVNPKKLALGAEMFEADNQLVLDEYLAGRISKSSFEAEARLWKNYGTDYAPLVELAKEHSVPFIAANVPRRYASAVSRKGLAILDSLSTDARDWLPPLPLKVDYELPGYKAMEAMMGSHGSGPAAKNLIAAQALKDASMAHRILLSVAKGKQVLHFNGAYHSDKHEGIVWYLKQQNPKLEILTISTVLQSEVNKLAEEHLDKADYILAIPERMTRTH
jgi:uncharacterized iron-regulated protein